MNQYSVTAKTNNSHLQATDPAKIRLTHSTTLKNFTLSLFKLTLVRNVCQNA